MESPRSIQRSREDRVAAGACAAEAEPHARAPYGVPLPDGSVRVAPTWKLSPSPPATTVAAPPRPAGAHRRRVVAAIVAAILLVGIGAGATMTYLLAGVGG